MDPHSTAGAPAGPAARSTPAGGMPVASGPAAPEITVIVAVRDHEDRVGHHVNAVASHLRSLRRSFEIVAVNDGSRDNSLPILELLKARVPELRVVRASAAGRAYQRGAVEAKGTVLLLLGDSERLSLAPLGWALSRLASGRDAVMLRGRYVVGRTLAVVPVLARAGGPGPLFESLFERRGNGLQLDVVGTRPSAKTPTARFIDPLLRFLTAS